MENEGFIVEDDYLSVEEMDYSDSEKDLIQSDIERRKLMQKRNRESKQMIQEQSIAGPEIFLFS